MSERYLPGLTGLENVMLALCTVGVALLVLRSYGYGVTKEGASSNPYADGHNMRFASMRDDGGGAVGSHKYEGYRSRRNYEGMLGNGEPPVFWGNVYSEVAAGQAQAAGLDEDDGSAAASNWKQEGARSRRAKEGMLDAALAGANVRHP